MSHMHDLAVRFWQDMVSRPGGPLAFRFILQPVTAAVLAIRDGYRDAIANRTPYLWTIIHEPSRRWSRLHEGVTALLRLLLLGVAMDIAYQLIRLHGLRPIETVNIVFLFAFLPYLILRGPARRIAGKILRRKAERLPANPASIGKKG